MESHVLTTLVWLQCQTEIPGTKAPSLPTFVTNAKALEARNLEASLHFAVHGVVFSALYELVLFDHPVFLHFLHC